MDKIYHSHRAKYLANRINELRKAKLEPIDVLNRINQENLEKCEPPLQEDQIKTIISQSNLISEASKNEIQHTDRSNAIKFKRMFNDELFFCDKLGGWYCWDNNRWRLEDDNSILGEYAGRLLDDMRRESESSGDSAFVKHVKASHSRGRIVAMVELAKGERMTKSIEQIDSNDLLLNCQNGTINLNDCTLYPANRQDYITKIASASYIKDAQCPLWNKFLKEIFLDDEELIRYMQKVIGYAASGLSREQAMWVLYGNGMNGKGVFLETITGTLGDYVNSMPPSELILKPNEGISNEIAKLRASRFITTSESGQSKFLDEAKVKRLTGEERMSARFLFKESFEFYFKGKIFFMTNYKPEIRGYDKGIWRRIKPVPFEMNIDEDSVDKKLKEKLLTEKDGILAWIVDGFRLYIEEGLKEPKRVLDSLLEYKAESDRFGEFLESHCEISEEYEVGVSEILQAVNDWAKEFGLKVRRNDFADFLKKRGFDKYKKKVGWFWKGIKLVNNFNETLKQDYKYSERPY